MAEPDEAVLVTDQIGRILFANATACQQLGYRPDEILDVFLRDTYPPDLVEQNEEHLRRLHRGETIKPFPRRVRRRDNTTFNAQVEWKALDDGRLRVMMRPIT